jgi:hypothetical protein
VATATVAAIAVTVDRAVRATTKQRLRSNHHG